jgi:hypothetical protein
MYISRLLHVNFFQCCAAAALTLNQQLGLRQMSGVTRSVSQPYCRLASDRAQRPITRLVCTKDFVCISDPYFTDEPWTAHLRMFDFEKHEGNAGKGPGERGRQR